MAAMAMIWVLFCFNPHTREGATFGLSLKVGTNKASIHTPVRVRLGILVLPPSYLQASIHTPVRVRLLPNGYQQNGSMLQSTHP